MQVNAHVETLWPHVQMKHGHNRGPGGLSIRPGLLFFAFAAKFP
jgi:hypothetical protein